MIVTAVVVTAVVVADDHVGGVDPLTSVGGVPMVARAVRGLLDSGLVDHVAVLARPARADAVTAACAGLPVGVRTTVAPARYWAHADQRGAPRRGDGPITTRLPEVVLLHDAARPLAPPELAVAVFDAVRCGQPAAVPVLPMSDTAKQLDPRGVVRSAPDRATLRVVQTPQAIRSELLVGAPLRAAIRLAGAGTAVATVPGHALAFAVRTAWDLELARLLVTEE
jgi:2-C-methyl-D-erythritol 4-phosphate cytidylyltransferase